ncbi:MAG: aminodeoxychorismate synthase component I [Bernardetiaceae bacterium]
MVNQTPKEAARAMTRMAAQREAFFFLWDFEGRQPVVCSWEEAARQGIFFWMDGISNAPAVVAVSEPLQWGFDPVPWPCYAQSFAVVQTGLQRGDSFLTNLTCRTPLHTNYTLEQLFGQAKARFKLLMQDRLVSFSPEAFVCIRGERIATFPMKGTIDAHLPRAAECILNDPKEAAEHATIVDLLRNDLSQVAEQVRVARYRYLDCLTTHRGQLLQVSSEIVGRVGKDFWDKLGENFLRLLPAGSISGAPKTKTCQIIRAAEGQERGYFTGVFGYYDGEKLESAVLIRFIERDPNGRLYFRSGGGITAQSQAQMEYQEMNQKIYAPIY